MKILTLQKREEAYALILKQAGLPKETRSAQHDLGHFRKGK